MKTMQLLPIIAATLAGAIACVTPVSRESREAPVGEPAEASEETQSPYTTEIPDGYRDWRFISLAREEGALDDIRVVLGNDTAIDAYRDGEQPFPEESSSRVSPTASTSRRRTTRPSGASNLSSRGTRRTGSSSW